MVDKIQYNYPVISILNICSFIKLPINSANFDRWKNYNGVKIDGKICFSEDIDAFIRMHKLINLQNKTNNELKWLQSQSLNPEGIVGSHIVGRKTECMS